MARKGFWGKFDELIDAIPGYIDEQIEAGDNSITTVGSNNVVSIGGGSSIKQTSSFGKSSTVIKQGGKKIVVTTQNGNTIITVDGKEYIPKEEVDGKN